MLKIAFQNDSFCAVDKPAGWLSVPSRTGSADPRLVVGKQLEQKLKQKVWPCHRLDEDVSGLLLFALNAEAHRSANRWFEAHEIIKTYEAWAELTPDTPEISAQQIWHCKLMRGKKRAYEADFGKESKTIAWLKCFGTFQSEKVAIWHLQPLTGRSHQLRYEMARHGWPILGDALYGSQSPWRETGIALRAIKLDLTGCANREVFKLPNEISISGLERVL